VSEPRVDHRSAPPDPDHHRDIQGGGARAAVFGVSDGLVSNLGLILGVAGADPAPGVVRLAGLAGLVAGAISMAAGEWNSMKVQNELFERELEIERIELRRHPQAELAELTQLYVSRGMPADEARTVAETLMSDPDLALQTHAREELGVDPEALGSPWAAATSSLVAFTIGAFVPLVPWFFGRGGAAVVASLVLAIIAAVAVGVAISKSTDRPAPLAVGRQLAFTLVPAALTYAIGRAIGVNGI
jgi:VIT1/CCC1 family predicted Fe2+/Mn2+ transporter